MTERPGKYEHNGKPPTVSTSSREIAEKFANAIGELNWTIDYFRFCELLELEPGEYANDQYRYFQQLAESLTRFNAESLAKMIDAGSVE
ncbi:MAG: hypothetical protein RMZ43_018520 [Nostoc sp. CmiVER01]|uniref:hypothetical protein n=1 Tax=Nostoc sp. CmiVER01 TaxID=3075384 RepID=UPI002AD42DA9|nr:hypothetical protein [Nostoc sp. CmiVER01]MDZ8126833.1 hypothetical protein [Nostoc sp. CmiVER01]